MKLHLQDMGPPLFLKKRSVHVNLLAHYIAVILIEVGQSEERWHWAVHLTDHRTVTTGMSLSLQTRCLAFAPRAHVLFNLNQLICRSILTTDMVTKRFYRNIWNLDINIKFVHLTLIRVLDATVTRELPETSWNNLQRKQTQNGPYPHLGVIISYFPSVNT